MSTGLGMSGVWVCSAMQTAWRERDKEARIQAAKDILENNPEFVYCLY